MATSSSLPPIRLRLLGTVPYHEALEQMRRWTAVRHAARMASLRPPGSGRSMSAMVATGPACPPTAPDPPGTAAGHLCQSTDTLPSALTRAVSRVRPDPTQAALLGDEIWLMQHPPVFTLGLNARTEHLHDAGDIPVVPTERGGQITYHGPGQIMAYLMLDLRTRRLGIRHLVDRVESAIIDCLTRYGIQAIRQEGAPGIYVRACSDTTSVRPIPSRPSAMASKPIRHPVAVPAADVAKIASIGLKSSHGFSYHGLALNGQMDLSPFLRINPCGFQNLRMTDVYHEAGAHSDIDLDDLALNLGRALCTAIEG